MNRALVCGALGVALVTCIRAAPAAAISSVQSGDWHVPATWEQGVVPQAGDEVTVVSGHVVAVRRATEALAALRVDGALISQAWDAPIQAAELIIEGVVSHAANTDTNGADGWTADARLLILCSNLVLRRSGKVDTTGKGYPPGDSYGSGRGPGGGFGGHSPGGASHGGKGSAAYYSGSGARYGDARCPEQPGSSGGGWGGDQPRGSGGAGGGAVRIIAGGDVALDGQVVADGAHGGPHSGAGGAGGSVWITCARLLGDGAVLARGGAGHAHGGSGGGGRVSLEYRECAFAGIVDLGSLFSEGWGWQGPGDPGTLWASDGAMLRDVMKGQRFRWTGPPLRWEAERLDMVNSEIWLDLTNAAAPRVKGAVTLNRSVLCLMAWPEVLVDTMLEVGGDLVLTNGSTLKLWSGQPNAVNGGERVLVGGELRVMTGCRVLPHAYPNFRRHAGFGVYAFRQDADGWERPDPATTTNGGVVRFEVGALRVDEGGEIHASARGYAGGVIVGGQTNQGAGFGPGGTFGAFAGGASHGGAGRPGLHGAPAGKVYGDEQAPTKAGSGGGADMERPSWGGDGGGMIWVEARRQVVVDGNLLANGESTWHGGAPGSGGAIRITCGAFRGSGQLQARGGNGGEYAPGAGGGRIAVRSGSTNGWFGAGSTPEAVAGGANGARHPRAGETAEAGTVFFKVHPRGGIATDG